MKGKAHQGERLAKESKQLVGIPIRVPTGVGKDDDNYAGDDEANPWQGERYCRQQRILCLGGGYQMPQAWRLVSGICEEVGELAARSFRGGDQWLLQ